MRGRPLWSVVAATLTGLAVGYAIGVGPPATPRPTTAEIPAALAGFLPPLDVLLPATEASGIVASRRHPGVYYWLRDSGPDKPERPRTALWGMRLDEAGRPTPVRGDALFPSYPVTGASNDDWEALTIDDGGDLWIGQLGANDCRRRQRVHRIAEPDPATEGSLPVLSTYDVRFPDNPKSGCRTYNSEAMFWIDGHLYVFAKTDRSPVYRVDFPEAGRQATLTRIGQLGYGIDNISASSVSADRTRLMVLDHERLWVYEVDPARRGDDLVRDTVGRAPAWDARFAGDGGATVEGGTFARASHRLAFVAEDRRIYVTDPAAYGDTPPAVCPSPTATPEPGATPDPTATPEPGATPDPTATPEPGATPDPTDTGGPDPTPSPSDAADPQPTTSST
jgi:hypothetical protein